MTHFDAAYSRWTEVNNSVLDFGFFMMRAIDEEHRTIREMSIKLCGNKGLEDRIGRWVMAARWQQAILPHPLYEDAMDWLTPSHFTYYWKIYQRFDMEYALDVFERTFVRTARNEVSEVHPYEWVRAHLGKGESTYVEKLQRYSVRLVHDLIETPFDGLSSKEQLHAAANIRESAKALHENIGALLMLIEAEGEAV